MNPRNCIILHGRCKSPDCFDMSPNQSKRFYKQSLVMRSASLIILPRVEIRSEI